MRILLDESAPRLIKTQLRELDITTVQEMGWAGIENGELLRLAEEEFTVFVTADKNLRHQQNLSQRMLAIVLLPSNQVPVVAASLPALKEVLQRIRPSDFVELPFPTEPYD